MAFSIMALMSIGIFTSCNNDDDNGSAPSDVFHPINASSRTLRDIIEKSEYTPTEFGDATPDLQALFRLRGTYIGEGAVMLGQTIDYENLIPNPPTQKYHECWYPRLPFYMSVCPDDELISYDGMKKYYTQLRTLPDGTVNNQVQWYDFYMPGVVKKIINTEQIKELSGGTPIHLLSAVLSLYDACTVNNPSDMEKVLVDDSMLPQE